MVNTPDPDTNGWCRRKILQISTTGVITGTVVSAGSSSVLSQKNETDVDYEESNNESETNNESDEEAEDNGENNSTCDESPGIQLASLTTLNNEITTNEPGIIEASLQPEQIISEECTIVCDLELSLSNSKFRWDVSGEWDLATSDILVSRFEVQPGEIYTIQGEIHTQSTEVVDSVTVFADINIWFEDNPEESIQKFQLQQRVNVEEPDDDIDDTIPGFNVLSSIIGIGGAAYVLKSKLTDDSN